VCALRVRVVGGPHKDPEWLFRPLLRKGGMRRFRRMTGRLWTSKLVQRSRVIRLAEKPFLCVLSMAEKLF